MGIDTVFILPVEVEHKKKHQKHNVGELKGVECYERPYLVQNHEFKLDREGGKC